MTRRGVAVTVAIALLMGACSRGDDDTSAATTTLTRSTASTAPAAPVVGIPPEVEAAGDEWPLPGRDYENSRARLDSQITRDNVDDLDIAWTVELPGSGAFGNSSTTPVIAGGVVYLQDLQSNVWAIELESGAVRWKHEYNRFQIGPSGVAIGYGKVFAAAGDREIVALDIDNGDELWVTDITTSDADGVDIQPTVVGNLVLVGTVPIGLRGQYVGGNAGIVKALDVETGEQVWEFNTVEPPDLWGNPEVNSGGGAWYPPAVDVTRGLVYWGIGNPAPFPGTPEFPNGSSRPGPNLYTDSVLALRIETGELAWYHQAVEHDLFDRDLQLTAINDGHVIGTGKLGRVIALDPDTGSLVSDTEVGTHRNDELTELEGPTEVYPGLFGGVLTPFAAAEGVAYVAVLNAPNTHEPDRENFFAGAELGVQSGQVVAVDLATGDIVWDTEIDGDPLGGTLVTGDLVFTGTYQGLIVVLDRATGEIVRTFDAPGGVNGWPAATSDTIVWPIGMADPPALVAYRVDQG